MDTILTVGLMGVLLAAVTALHLHLTTPPAQPISDQPSSTTPAPTPVSPEEIDAEFFRIIDRAIG